MGLQDAKGAELAALAHDRLDDWYAFELFNGKFVHCFHEFKFSNVTEAILAMLAKSAILTKHPRVCQTLNHTICETGIAHII